MKDSVTTNFKFMQALMKVENGIKSGYDKDTDTWSPHPSPEGGLPTLGYGHKLEQRDVDNGDIFINAMAHPVWGMPDDMVITLFTLDVTEAEEQARNEWNQYKPQGALSWDYVPQKYRAILTNLVFNVGSLAPKGHLGWPKLFDAIKRENDSEVLHEATTSYRRPDGVRVKLTRRIEVLGTSLGMIQ